eukprot:g2365.t1
MLYSTVPMALSGLVMTSLSLPANARVAFFSNMSIPESEEMLLQASSEAHARGQTQFIKGYNIYRGSPLSFQIGAQANQDPGRRYLGFFDLSHQNTHTQDVGAQQFELPTGLGMKECETFTMSYKTTFTSGEKSYQNELSKSIKGSFDFAIPAASFKASASYKGVTAEEDDSGESTFNSITSAAACIYSLFWSPAVLVNRTVLPFDPVFQSRIDELSNTTWMRDGPLYIKLIEDYGTHYFKEADFGAFYAEQASISESSYRNMLANNVNIEAAAEASAWGATVSVELKSEEDKKNEDEFKKATTNRAKIVKGAVPPGGEGKNIKFNEWVDDVRENPQIQRAIIETIYALFTPESHHYEQLKLALDGYCSHLVLTGELENCNAPTESYDLPKAIDSDVTHNVRNFFSKISELEINKDTNPVWEELKREAITIFNDQWDAYDWYSDKGWIHHLFNLFRPLGFSWEKVGMLSAEENGYKTDANKNVHEWELMVRTLMGSDTPLNQITYIHPQRELQGPKSFYFEFWDKFLRFSIAIGENALENKSEIPDAMVWEQLLPTLKAEMRKTLRPRSLYDSPCRFPFVEPWTTDAKLRKMVYKPVFENCYAKYPRKEE